MKLFLVAGEPSGDALGAALMAGLKQLAPDVAFHGVGGPRMQQQGLTSLFPMEELSVMGLMEVLPKYRALKRRLEETARAAAEIAPDALITIDSPDFCLRLAARLRELRPQQRTIHYVAPTVWAWRPKRAERMARVIDHVLALFPFEPPYMERAGMTCDFVGHPVVAEPWAGPDQAAAFRAEKGIGRDQPLLLCLPGSRRGEVRRLGPRFGEAIARLRDREPSLRVAVPTLPSIAPMVRQMVEHWPVQPVVVEQADARRAAFAAADLALAASGTVSLELAANSVPMVVAYDFNRLSWWMIRRAALIDTVTLVNIVSDTRAVPEFLGPDCRPGPIADALARLLDDDAERRAQIEAMEVTMQRLGRGQEVPGLRAARSVLDFLARSQ
ncbi:lipid-A-disaccharide synthase [Albidovulum inexpectatum]|uniref:Lipid-A-disaccharide synthase n=1 Tax=Albidovulum inexpectatum TaxID=196587 RepID=A0A2S5JFG5_9RHOB|nr:lipid-A-disaccharide synthase [Albidovulum inexpectatum]PPB80108.1 lipid-A-disaccharide synthase [Albidovulum inexpectatum]